MLVEIIIGIKMKISSEDLFSRTLELLREAKYPLDPPDISGKDIVQAMRRDKKVQRSTIRIVVPKKLGHVEIRDIKDEGIIAEAWGDLSERLK